MTAVLSGCLSLQRKADDSLLFVRVQDSYQVDPFVWWVDRGQATERHNQEATVKSLSPLNAPGPSVGHGAEQLESNSKDKIASSGCGFGDA
ncbi:hypothetical protein CB1_000115008 [Camelus ferus]|nr:hypothetical protein CB1_000115008 [Camelus ferus]